MKLTLFGTLGFPGSGKTYFARRFSKEFGFFHLSSDYLRVEMFPEPTYQPDEQKVVFGAMNYIANAMLSKNISVIYDANSTRKEYRQNLLDIAEKYGAQYRTLWFQTPVELALKRLEERKELIDELEKRYHRPVGPEVLYSLKAEEEDPTGEPLIIIDASQDYEKEKNQVLQAL